MKNLMKYLLNIILIKLYKEKVLLLEDENKTDKVL